MIKRSQTHCGDGKFRLIANLKQVQKNPILTVAAAASVLAVAPVYAAHISLPVRAESPLTKVADTRQPMLIAHPTNFLLPSS
ncbi:hypothetical protein [Microcoleus sp. S13_B4]|uniref:hypothetical protein n=1 Tax=Microcoleus sp. S13_B4 TaxID=3055408 RepID=UPI002FD70624